MSDTAIFPVPVTEITPRLLANTYNWDTVVALHFDTTNMAIIDKWGDLNDKVKSLSQSASENESYNIQAKLGPWQLTTGGDGKNINMAVPVTSGIYQAGVHSYQLDEQDMKVVIQINMDWIPAPDQMSFVINSGVAAIIDDLMNGIINTALINDFAARSITVDNNWSLSTKTVDSAWLLGAPDDSVFYYLFFSQDKDHNQFLSVYQYTKSFRNQLVALGQESGGTPAVVVINVLNAPNAGSIGNAVLNALLSEWFNSNIIYFNFIFSVIDLTPQFHKSPGYTWIDPTSTSYAVTDLQSMSSSMMGVLTMVQNNIPGDNHQVSINAIPTGEDANGADVGILISGQNFIKNMLLVGAKNLFYEASDDDFTLSNDGLSIRNVKKLTYGFFKKGDDPDGVVEDYGYSDALDKGSLPLGLIESFRHSDNNCGFYYFPDLKGASVKVNVVGSQWFLSGNSTEYIVDLKDDKLEVYTATQITIPAGQFEMNLEHSFLEIKFINLYYSESWQYDVHINYTEQMSLGLKTVTTSAGETKQLFSFTQSVRSMTVNVTKTQSVITLEIVMGAINGALALVAILGPVIEGLTSAAEVTIESAEEGSAIISESAFVEELSGNVEAEEQNAVNEEDALSCAIQQTSGRMTTILNAFNSTRWQVFGYIIAAISAAYGVNITVTQILEAVYQGDWDNVPYFDDFANSALKPYTFPGVEGYELKSAWLADSLQIGLKAKPE